MIPLSRKERLYYALSLFCLAIGALGLFVFTAVRFTGLLFCCAAVVFAVFGLLSHWSGKRPWARWAKRVLLALLAAGFAFFAVLEARVISWARTDSQTPVTAVIVLGAGVNGTQPSLSLRTRLDAALAYVEDRPGIPVVVTGSQGQGEDLSEAQCMYNWLTAHGVSQEQIILEEQANNTEENIYYSLALLEGRGVDITDSIAVVTSDYHLCRASMHMEGNMVPVAAYMPSKYLPLTINYYVREAFGVAKEHLF